ncbi:MAG TPA: heparan-alpha-glucosaminide N-acetyltransferase domain-containing protein [Planctomycetaceae bacterium]|jgi:predicted acyltransferase|nr:heparan-alpha-glucosaminide N-acetyltransferase domain-containing protein [Planctomycetaceae bacterium]
MATAPPAKPRLASLDQFRGYTVAGMFVVNFLAAYDSWVPPVLLHHHTYCSYADTIMPQFLFAVGFAMRLSFGRRVQSQGLVAGYARMVRRIVGLFLVAFAIYVEGHVAENWHDLAALGAWNAVSPYLKRHWLDTLGQIALTSLWILPVIRAGARVRILFAVASAALHVWLSHVFNYHWANTDPNGLDGGPLGFLTWSVPTILGTLTCDAIVDAPARPPLARLTLVAFLVMGLGYIFSCGTRLYDLSPAELVRLKEASKAQDDQRTGLNDQIDAARKAISAHTADEKKIEDQIAEIRRDRLKAKVAELMSKRENAEEGQSERAADIEEAERQLSAEPPDPRVVKLSGALETLNEDGQTAKLESRVAGWRVELHSIREVKLAPSPVVPPQAAWKVRPWKTLLAEPPFFQPAADDPRVDPPPYMMHRYWNYWMMTQRGGSLSYVTFGAGFSLLVYVLFYALADMLGVRIGVFRTFGTNALAAYVLHGIIGGAVKSFIPQDAPAWYVITALCLDFCLIWLFVRTLEKNKIFLRV